MKRWRLLEDCPALLQSDWLPPAEVWPELAHLREEHTRLLALVREEQNSAAEAHKRYEAEEGNRRQALKAGFLTGSDSTPDGGTAPEAREAELSEAQLRVEAACDALVTFLAEAMAAIEQQADEWYATLALRRAEAQAKREEVRRILAETDAQVAETERMRLWLDRESGRSALGHFPFEQMAVPTGEPDLVHAASAIEEVSDAA